MGERLRVRSGHGGGCRDASVGDSAPRPRGTPHDNAVLSARLRSSSNGRRQRFAGFRRKRSSASGSRRSARLRPSWRTRSAIPSARCRTPSSCFGRSSSRPKAGSCSASSERSCFGSIGASATSCRSASPHAELHRGPHDRSGPQRDAVAQGRRRGGGGRARDGGGARPDRARRRRQHPHGDRQRPPQRDRVLPTRKHRPREAHGPRRRAVRLRRRRRRRCARRRHHPDLQAVLHDARDRQRPRPRHSRPNHEGGGRVHART